MSEGSGGGAGWGGEIYRAAMFGPGAQKKPLPIFG